MLYSVNWKRDVRSQKDLILNELLLSLSSEPHLSAEIVFSLLWDLVQMGPISTMISVDYFGQKYNIFRA